jgi:hypothetical protein
MEPAGDGGGLNTADQDNFSGEGVKQCRVGSTAGNVSQSHLNIVPGSESRIPGPHLIPRPLHS